MWRRLPFLIALLPILVQGFVTPKNNVVVRHLSASTSSDILNENFSLSLEETKPIFRFGEKKNEKIINAFGLVVAFASIITCPIWLLAMTIVGKIGDISKRFDKNRAIYDYTGKIWSRIWLKLSRSYPTITGEVKSIREREGACLYVANHASWMDIAMVCTVLNPVFKFIAKAELAKIPCIGQQLKGGKHILIDRTDRRSQLRSFKEGIAWLKQGVPLMAFPEGARSKDGKLMDFKGGIFAMAMKAKVPIVPLSLSHSHAVFPGFSLLPVQPGKGKLNVHVHKPIDSEGKTDEELTQLVRDALLSEMPKVQHPDPVEKTEEVQESATV